MLSTIGAIIAIIVAVMGILVQLITAGIYIGKLEGFKMLVDYRFAEQEKKLDKHNNIVEKTYCNTRDISVLQEQQKVENHRISDLENLIK
ncbi:MAG: hypothetical protein OSJ27_08990 [Candidatus Gastranaerophilales bacterium]|nr:hypothetical protein [Candidatus Gastranaerophilales bacterium]